MNKYHIVLCLLVTISSVCFGMDEQKLWIIKSIASSTLNPHYELAHIEGKLKIYYQSDDSAKDKYKVAAQFEPYDKSKKVIIFKNFDDNEYRNTKKLVECLDSIGQTRAVNPSIFILADPEKKIFNQDLNEGEIKKHVISESKILSTVVLSITNIEHSSETEELLHMKRCRVILRNDNIELQDVEGTQKIINLCHRDNITAIRNALSLNAPFILDTAVMGPMKVTRYTNGSYLQWDGWIPFIYLLCREMSMPLTKISSPKTIIVNAFNEQESLHHHQRNKWIGRGLMVLTVALIGYLLRNKIYNVGSLFLQDMGLHPANIYNKLN